MTVLHFCSTTVDTPYFAKLCSGLSAAGVSTVVGSLSEAKPPPWLGHATELRSLALGARSRRDYPRAVVQLARLLRRARVDVMQTHLFDAGLVGLFAARLARTPVRVVTRHHLDESWLMGRRVHVALDRWMARSADVVVVPSRAVRDHMVSREGLSGDNIEVIYLGYDFAELTAGEEDREHIRRELGLGSSFVVGCVARFFKNKGHRYLFAACRELAAEITDLRLLLLGSGDREGIEAMIREHGLDGRVVLAGYRRDIPACMRGMDLLVHPSLSESFGQVIVEAMAAGTAVVATEVGGVPEIVTHGETGLLVPPRDPGAIVRAVRELYRQPDLRRRLALAGRESVRARFSIERMVDLQLRCYHRWLARSRNGGTGLVATAAP